MKDLDVMNTAYLRDRSGGKMEGVVWEDVGLTSNQQANVTDINNHRRNKASKQNTIKSHIKEASG